MRKMAKRAKTKESAATRSRRKREQATGLSNSSSQPVVAIMESEEQLTTIMDSNEQPVVAASSSGQPSVTTDLQQESGVTADSPVHAAATITLGAHCCVKDAVALKSSLCAVVETPDSVVLDAAAVERVDTATMQLLCAFVRERAAHSRGIVWHGVPSALNEAARLLGLQSHLGLPLSESSGAAA